jgi:NADPH2:quinone reductase
VCRYFRSGLYPAPNLPYILGRESSGVVQSVGAGNVFNLSPGDRVVALSQTTYAQYTAASAQTVYKIPDGVSTEAAAAGLLQGLTALTLIREAHAVKKGDWVLVHAAAGGVGLLLVQLLKAVGAKIIATCSTSKLELVKSKGVDVLIDYSKDDFVPKVKEATGGAGVVAVFDGVGKSTFDGSLESVARKGSMISYGNASGPVPPFTIASVYYHDGEYTANTKQSPFTQEPQTPQTSTIWLHSHKARV